MDREGEEMRLSPRERSEKALRMGNRSFLSFCRFQLVRLPAIGSQIDVQLCQTGSCVIPKASTLIGSPDLQFFPNPSLPKMRRHLYNHDTCLIYRCCHDLPRLVLDVSQMIMWQHNTRLRMLY